MKKLTKAQKDLLVEIANDDELLEIGREAIETRLVETRDARLSKPLRGNGLVIKERDGTLSSLIRLGPEDGLRIGLVAIAEAE